MIIIFAGWSTDATFYSHIKKEGWDIAVVSGYSELRFPVENTDGYSTIALFAWSLGVYAAYATVPFDRISLAVAINGTESPVDDKKGIPVRIYETTSSTLDERNLIKFQKRISGKSYDQIKGKFPHPDIGSLQRELDTIKASSAVIDRSRTPRWDRVYISSDDMIFPSQMQHSAWESHPSSPDIIDIESPHYVDLQPIINGLLPAESKVGERFRRASGTYDSEAYAQKRIADHLAAMCPEKRSGRVVEIGPGTGLLTRNVVGRIHPETMEFVDLYEIQPFSLVGKEIYHVADAEKWISKEAEDYPASADAVVSASVIQWFANPEEFFSNVSILLKPGGMLLCSSFLPGNLEELKTVNPFCMVYRSLHEIESYLKRNFSGYHIEEDTIRLDFKNPRDALIHLRHTGVGGSGSSGMSLNRLLKRLPSSLTYRPVYIRAFR